MPRQIYSDLFREAAPALSSLLFGAWAGGDSRRHLLICCTKPPDGLFPGSRSGTGGQTEDPEGLKLPSPAPPKKINTQRNGKGWEPYV